MEIDLIWGYQQVRLHHQAKLIRKIGPTFCFLQTSTKNKKMKVKTYLQTFKTQKMSLTSH